MIAADNPDIADEGTTVQLFLEGLAHHPKDGTLARTAVFTGGHTFIPELHAKLHALQFLNGAIHRQNTIFVGELSPSGSESERTRSSRNRRIPQIAS